jgi:hypothetical protein
VTRRFVDQNTENLGIASRARNSELETGTGKKVSNPKQAIAIGLREAGASKYESEKNRENLKRTKERDAMGASPLCSRPGVVHLAETTTCSRVGGCFAAPCAAGECVHEVNQALRIAPSRMRLMNYKLECSLGRLDATRRIIHGVWFGRLRVDISRIASLEHVGYGFVQPMDGSNTSPFNSCWGAGSKAFRPNSTERSAATPPLSSPCLEPSAERPQERRGRARAGKRQILGQEILQRKST